MGTGSLRAYSIQYINNVVGSKHALNHTFSGGKKKTVASKQEMDRERGQHLFDVRPETGDEKKELNIDRQVHAVN